MTSITQGMGAQYADSSRLAARARIHQFGHAPVPWFPWVAGHLQVGPGVRILDVGCGPAWFWPQAIEVIAPGAALTLFDQSQGMVDEALERCRDLPLASVEGCRGDAEALPFPDASFDAVIAMHMLYHVPDQAKAIAEFHRVLKPGGCCLVTTNDVDDMLELYRMTAVFGSDPVNPAGAAFGFERGETLMLEQFGNVVLHVHPQTMRVTDPDVVYLALTSYPPGDSAPPDQQAAFREAIDAAFTAGGGGIDVTRRVGVLVSLKP
ncbi:class I SAM-dependent methyltransferase [Devosia sediminis]|uniref:Methyltransferase domain-containing protein n=1 Tax=Devosia sediminis TaxID=2798801 RepID=A0A934IZ68_9HYPH|nr:methyltransferase domain-containing protein [Devosia sediminis]MBJ3785413.1 methyltransferase domain-containing protein [Devosia sediminis]